MKISVGIELVVEPGQPRLLDVLALLLGGMRGLFVREAVPSEELPDAGNPDADAALGLEPLPSLLLIVRL